MRHTTSSYYPLKIILLQLVSWLILIIQRDLSKKAPILQENALYHPILFKFMCFKMSNGFNVSLFPMSKYQNKEPQLVSWLIATSAY